MPGRAEVDGRRRGRGRDRADGLRGGHPLLSRRGDEAVEAEEEPLEPPVRRGERRREVVRELDAAAVRRDHPPHEADAQLLEHAEVERSELRAADELQRRLAARGLEVRHVGGALGEDAGAVEPPHHVAAAVRAREADVAADGERHRPARPVDLGGELEPGRRGADDEHAARRKRLGVPVSRRDHLDDVVREPRRERRDGGPIAVPGRDDDRGRGSSSRDRSPRGTRRRPARPR